MTRNKIFIAATILFLFYAIIIAYFLGEIAGSLFALTEVIYDENI